MSVSCLLFADGAVRLPSGRLTPKADQSRLEICCGERSLVAKARAVDRFASASINGIPPVFCGAGSSMDCARRFPARKAARRMDNFSFNFTPIPPEIEKKCWLDGLAL